MNLLDRKFLWPIIGFFFQILCVCVCVPRLFQAFFCLSWLSALRSFHTAFVLVTIYTLTLFQIFHYYSYMSVSSWLISVRNAWGLTEGHTSLLWLHTSPYPISSLQNRKQCSVCHQSKPGLFLIFVCIVRGNRWEQFSD